MTYVCCDCHAAFCNPIRTVEGFSHEFGTEQYESVSCPWCRSEHICEAVHCDNPACSRFVRRCKGGLCLSCKAELKRRIVEFFDTLTEPEEKQFDEWMDGDSITSRKDWSLD